MASKVQFFSLLNLPPFSVTPPGSHMCPEYVEALDDSGTPIIKQTGEFDMQAQIDSFAEDCDIYKILDRLGVSTKSPDVVLEAISQFHPDMFVPGKFGDFSKLPENIHEVAKLHRDAVEFFNNLPSDIRAEYGFSVDRFFADFDGFVAKYGQSSAAVSDAASAAPSTEGGNSNE